VKGMGWHVKYPEKKGTKPYTGNCVVGTKVV
jgi:hypothetical protein